MRRGSRFDVVVLQHADGAIDFEHRERRFFVGADAVLTERALQFVHADVLFGHVRFDDLAVVHQQTGLSLNVFSEAAIHARNFGHQVVQDEERGSCDRASGKRRIWTGHRILHRIRKQEQQREIEWSHLSDFALATDANSDQHEKVDYSSAERDLEKRVRVGRQHLW